MVDIHVPRIGGEEHQCSARREVMAFESLLRRMHDVASVEELMYGRSIHRIVKSGGYWWATNDEYSTMILCCPFCSEALSGAGHWPEPGTPADTEMWAHRIGGGVDRARALWRTIRERLAGEALPDNLAHAISELLHGEGGVENPLDDKGGFGGQDKRGS